MNAVSPLKRMTIFCRDIEASLALYRDILGFDVAEDKVVEGEAMGGMIGYPEGVKMRIVHLQSEKSDNGLIGLYAIQDPIPDALPRPPTDRILWGQTALVVSADGVDDIVPKLKQGGYEFLLEPREYFKAEDSDYMKAGTYTETMFFDNDGVLVSIIAYRPLPAS